MESDVIGAQEGDGGRGGSRRGVGQVLLDSEFGFVLVAEAVAILSMKIFPQSLLISLPLLPKSDNS